MIRFAALRAVTWHLPVEDSKILHEFSAQQSKSIDSRCRLRDNTCTASLVVIYF